MLINRKNYESILVDYAEGTLTAEIRRDVEKFLLLNPDIKEEFDLYSNDYIKTSNETFSEKDVLKKIPLDQTTSSSDYFQHLCVAHIEGILTGKERIFFDKLVKEDADKQKELALFEKTKLLIDKRSFNEKLLVKKQEIIHMVTNDNFEEYCVASIEGWLNQAGLIALNNYITTNPKQKRVLDIYYKTRLTSDFSIIYPDKRKIKRFTVLSPTIKKHASFISSVAAIVVLSFMIFYTTTLDDKTQLSGNITNSINSDSVKKTIIKEKTDTPKKTVNKKVKKQSILHDPFGFENISGKNRQTATNNTLKSRVVVNHIQPIRIKQLDCPPCKQVFTERLMLENFYNKTINELSTEKNNNRKRKEETLNETRIWELAQVGISGINKITNTELKVEKNENGNKTKIAFNSRLFSFSTNVNKNN